MKAKIALCAILLAMATWSEAATITIRSLRLANVSSLDEPKGLPPLIVQWFPKSTVSVSQQRKQELAAGTKFFLKEPIQVPSDAGSFKVTSTSRGKPDEYQYGYFSYVMDVTDGKSYDIELD